MGRRSGFGQRGIVLALAGVLMGCGEKAAEAEADRTASSTSSELFDAPNAWDLDVSMLRPDERSSRIVEALAQSGGFGTGQFRIDFSLQILWADAGAPFRKFTKTADFYSPDCDDVPFPIPAGGALEGEDGYACDNGGDCHLLVVHPPSRTLYEMWRANISGGTFFGGCAAVWHLDRSYADDLRGLDCTSADAAGFPIAALLFTADEVAKGAIEHAIRFILPNERIRHGVYVAPATHSTSVTGGGTDAPPYGVRLRLRASFPLEVLSPPAQVVARAMQRYGMLLADGGNIALTAASDRFSVHRWSDVGLTSNALAAIDVRDLEVVAMGTPTPYRGDCTRVP